MVFYLVASIMVPGVTVGSARNDHEKTDSTLQFDIIVYGGTPAGITAAVAAAREGANVAVIEPSYHLGGMMTSGLCATDKGKAYVIGGLAGEFFRRVGEYYNRGVGWNFEPHVAEKVFNDMIKQANVKVYMGQRLREKDGALKSGSNIIQITMESGLVFKAKEYIDCSYDGDLMAQSSVSYTYGREGVAQYGESLAGVRPYTDFHNFTELTSGFDGSGNLLPEVSAGKPGETGSADKKIQAYNFRLCITDDPKNLVPFPKPENYDPSRYKLSADWLKVLKKSENGRKLGINDVLGIISLPGRKADANNYGPFSTDYIGGSWDYPVAGYTSRERIINDHKDYTQGLLYFLSNDPQVPAELRQDMKKWGLAADEFTDNGNWPYQLYIRESRRMVGEYVMTQKDIQTDTAKYDTIGMGSYNSDSHNTQRYVTLDGNVLNEGDMQVKVEPYQIPYRIMLPKSSEASNLLVPVCLSASHVAYSTLRMEPQYMIMGHAAGLAAKMALDGGVTVQDIDIRKLQEKLKKQGAVLELPDTGGILYWMLYACLFGAAFLNCFAVHN